MEVSPIFAPLHSPLLLLLTLLVPIFSVLILFFAKKSSSDGRRRLPPSPRGLPILGHLPLLGSLPHRELQSLAEAHGPVMLLRLGRVPTVVASSAAAAQEAMKTRDLAFASRAAVRMAERLLYGRDVVFAPYGEYWRQARRVCVLHLLSPRRVLSFRRVREQEVAALLDRVRSSSLYPPDFGAVNLSDMLISYANAVIKRAAFGDGEYGFDGDEAGGGEKLRHVLADFEELLGTATVGEFVPWLAWVDTLTGLDAKANRTFKAMDGLLERVIADHRRRRLVGGRPATSDGEDDRRDFVDVLLDVSESGEEAGGVRFDTVGIKAIILVFAMTRGQNRHVVNDDDNSVESIGVQSDFERSNSLPDDSVDESSSSHGQIDPTFLKNLRKLVTPSKRKGLFHNNSKKAKRKRDEVDIAAKKTVSRCNVSYLSEIIKDLSVDEKEVITRYGFGSLLHLDCEPIPRSFAQWIADHVNTRSGDIVLDKKVIPMSPESVHMVLGIPLGGRPIKFNAEASKTEFLQVIGQHSLPTIKFFGNEMKKANLTDDQLVRNFLVVAMSVFLCPNSNTYPSTKYVGALINPKESKEFDFSKFVFDWLIAYIKKYKRESKKPSNGIITLGGCLYKLAVIYLDFLDFGLRSVPIGFPRIKAWKKCMIKQFATLDCESSNEFCQRPVKDISLTVYKSGCVGCCAAHSDPNSSKFKSSLDTQFGTVVPEKVRDDIVQIFRNFEMQIDNKYVKPAENLVLDVMECLAVASGCRSENHDNDSGANDNVHNSKDNHDAGADLPDSDGLNCMNQDDSCAYQSTLKVTSDEDIAEVHPQVEVRRKSRKRQNSRIDDQQNNSQDSVSSRTRQRLKSLESHRNSPSICQSPNAVPTLVQRNSVSNVDGVSLRNSPQPRVDVSKCSIGDENKICAETSASFHHLLSANDASKPDASSMFLKIQPMQLFCQNPIQELKVALTKTQGQEILNKSPVNTSPRCLSPHQMPIMMETLPFSTDDVIEVHNSQKPSQTKHKSSQPLPPFIPLPIMKCVDISSQDSPEVVFCGEKFFEQTCNEMCNTSDELHNQRSNSHKVSGSSSGKKQAHPKRMLAPSKYKASPYGDNKIKFSVSSLEAKYHDAIVRISAINEYKFNDCIDYGRVKLTFYSLGNSLKRRGLVDTYVVNAFCRKLSLDTRPRDSNKHHFFHSISEHFMNLNCYPNEDMLERKRAWVRRCFDLACGAKVIHKCEIVFFPTLHSDHWFVFAVLFGHQMFVFLDSLYGEFSDYHKTIQSIIIPNFIKTWQEFGSHPFDFSDFTVYFPKVPSQENAQDCGIFVMKFMEVWNPRRQLVDCFSQVDIPRMRCLYANQMLFSVHNKLTEPQDLVKNFDPRKQGGYAEEP